MTKSFNQRLQYYKTYVYNYYMINVKDSLELALIIGLSLVILIYVGNQMIIEQPKFKSWGVDGSVINETTFIRYSCFNNVTIKFNILSNKVEVVPNESNEACKAKDKP